MDEVTLGELARRLDALHVDVKEMRTHIVEHDDLKNVADGLTTALHAHEVLADARLQRVEGRVDALEAWQTWAMRIVLGLVITAIIGAFIIDPFKH